MSHMQLGTMATPFSQKEHKWCSLKLYKSSHSCSTLGRVARLIERPSAQSDLSKTGELIKVERSRAQNPTYPEQLGWN